MLFKPAPRINQTQPKRQILLLDDLSKYSHRHGLKFYELRWAGTLLSRAEVGSAGSHTWISPPRKHMSTREGLARLEEIPAQDDPARQLSAPLSAHDSAERAVSRMHFRGGGCFSGSCSYYHGNTVDRNLPQSKTEEKKTHIQVGKIYKIRT